MGPLSMGNPKWLEIPLFLWKHKPIFALNQKPILCKDTYYSVKDIMPQNTQSREWHTVMTLLSFVKKFNDSCNLCEKQHVTTASCHMHSVTCEKESLDFDNQLASKGR